MGFKCGIVGLPNVGKSTLFNALTKTAAAQAANYPFCTIEPLVEAWAVEDRYRLSFFDCLLLASAAAGRSLFLSEDMNGGQKIETLSIVNPFATAPEAVLGAD